MKKCPMTIDIGKYHPQSKHGGNDITKYAEYYTFATDCIGAKCAAYVEQMRPVKDRTSYFVSDITGEKQYINIKEVLMWACAMMPREVWHDVEDSNA